MKQLKGWKDVFAFTFHQSAKRSGFIIVTILVAVVILLGCVAGNVIVAYNSDNKQNKDKVKKSKIEKVYVLDESGLQATDYATMMKTLEKNKFTSILFETIENNRIEEVVKMAGNESEKSIAVHITTSEEGFLMEGILPEQADLSEKQVKELLRAMIDCFDTNKLTQVGLSMEQLAAAMSPVVTNYLKVGEDSNIAVMLIKMFGPMFFGLMMYMMLLLYGQNISKEVSTEKTSKLMDTLLTAIHPYALITGKVLAISSLAIMQMSIWIVSLIIGFLGGDKIAHLMYPEYENSVMTVIDFFRTNIGESALTPQAFILGMIFFCVGFLFYCVIAGLTGSMVSKPEDAASTQGLFQFPVMIGFLISYLAPIMGKDNIVTIARYVPFTSPFLMPIELITGTANLQTGVISAGILIVFSIAIIYLSAKIYKGLVLYTGQKISMKTMLGIIKAK